MDLVLYFMERLGIDDVIRSVLLLLAAVWLLRRFLDRS